MTTGSGVTDPVLVGVDGSEASTRAVRWAAREAGLRGCPLHIVHAWLWPLFRVPLGGSPLAPETAGLQAQAEQVLAAAATTARAVAPGLVVETTLTVGEAAGELLRRAPGAQLVVVGNRGLGGFTGLLLGSTGVALSARSPRPVVVVRGDPAPEGPVVVGVDTAPGSDAVLGRAIEEARLRGVGVLVVHGWTPSPLPSGPTPAGETALTRGRRAGQELLDRALAVAGSDAPGVTLSTRLGDRSPAAELVDASQHAQLLVVGARDLGSLRGMLLGSTTHAAIHHSACPVLVVR